MSVSLTLDEIEAILLAVSERVEGLLSLVAEAQAQARGEPTIQSDVNLALVVEEIGNSLELCRVGELQVECRKDSVSS